MSAAADRLTGGRVGSALLRFALPFLAAALLQQLYGTVDTMAVGRLCLQASSALAAVSTGSQVAYTLTTVVIGLSTGGTVLIGQYMGAGRKEDAGRVIGAMFPLFGLVGLAMSVLMAACAGPIVELMRVPDAAAGAARQYLVVCGAGMLFVTGYNMVSGIFRGLGDSRTPMYLVAIACVINIAGDIVLVGPLQLGALGAALATVAAQAVSFLCALILLLRRADLPVRLRWRALAPRRGPSALLLKLGAPLSMQDLFIGISFLLITTCVNRIGLDQAACVGVVSRVTTIAMLVPSAFQAAIAAMTAQNIGSGQPERAVAALRWGVVCSFLFSAAATAAAELWPAPILGLFIDDGAVIAQGVLYLRSNILDCALVPFVFCLNGFFSGCGHTGFSMVNNLISTFCVRVAGTVLISSLTGATMFHIGLAAPAASAVQIVIQVVYFALGRWRTSTILPGGPPAREG